MTTYNRLFVVPTADTMSYLSSVMSGCPIDLDLSQFRLEVITTEDALEIEPDRVYSSQAVNVNVYYDAALQRSSLICTLSSSDLHERCIELNREGVARPAGFPPFFIPHFTIRPDMPPMSVNIRRWRVSIANALCQSERVLSWTGEYVETEVLQHVPDLDYLNTMSAELHLQGS